MLPFGHKPAILPVWTCQIWLNCCCVVVGQQRAESSSSGHCSSSISCACWPVRGEVLERSVKAHYHDSVNMSNRRAAPYGSLSHTEPVNRHWDDGRAWWPLRGRYLWGQNSDSQILASKIKSGICEGVSPLPFHWALVPSITSVFVSTHLLINWEQYLISCRNKTLLPYSLEKKKYWITIFICFGLWGCYYDKLLFLNWNHWMLCTTQP